MECNIFKGHKVPEAKGICVVIDVLIAFTTVAFAFGSGTKEIITEFGKRACQQIRWSIIVLNTLPGSMLSHALKLFFAAVILYECLKI